ncbi:UNVERIFIED_CONTAM: hypothetical protein FKN15_018177 [Acipenser sinensis]
MEATSDSVLDWDHMTDLEDAQVLWYLQRLQGATLEEEEEEAVWEDLDSEDIPAKLLHGLALAYTIPPVPLLSKPEVLCFCNF